MALSVGSLIAFLKADTRSFDRGLRSAEQQAQQFAKKMETVTRGAQIAAVGFGLIGASAVKLASELEEAQGLAADAFSEGGVARVGEWAKATADAMGRSSKEIFEYATNLQALIAPMTKNKTTSEAMSKSLARAAVDLASAYNTEDAQALTAIRAGIAGEMEPLKRYGMVLSEVNLKEFAAKKGIKGKWTELNQATKTYIRAQYILENMDIAQGNAEKTAGSYANQVKRLHGNWTDFQVEVGTAILPALTDFVSTLNGAFHAFNDLDASTKKAIVSTVLWGGASTIAVGALGSLVQMAPSVVRLVRGVGEIGKAAQLAGVGLKYLWDGQKKATTYSEKMAQAMAGPKGVKGALLGFASAVSSAFKDVPGTLARVSGSFTGLLPALKAMGLAAKTAWLNVLWPAIAIAAAIAGIILIIGALAEAWDADLGGIATAVRSFIDWHVKAWNIAVNAILKFIRRMGMGFLDALDGMLKAWELTPWARMGKAMANGIRKGIDTARKWIDESTNLTKLKENLTEAWKTAGVVGKDSIQNIQNAWSKGISTLGLDKLTDKLKSLGGMFGGDNGAVAGAPSSAVRRNHNGLTGSDDYTDNAENGGKDKELKYTELKAIRKWLDGAQALRDVVAEGAAIIKQLRTNAFFAPDGGAAIGNAETGKPYVDPRNVVELFDPIKRALRLAAINLQNTLDTLSVGFAMMGKTIANKFAQSAPVATDMINSVIEGAKNGGVFGAIAGFLSAVMANSEALSRVFEMVNEIALQIVDAFDGVFQALEPIVGAAGALVQNILPALAPVLDMLVAFMEPLAPVLMTLAYLVGALAPIIQIVSAALILLLTPVKALVDIALRGLFEAFRWLAFGILWVVKGIADVWNGIVNAIAGFFDWISNFEVFGWKPFEFMGSWADALRKAQIQTDGMAETMEKLRTASWDSMTAEAQKKAADIKLDMERRKAAEKANEALTNIPSGYRIALTRFQATAVDTQQALSVASGGTSAGIATTGQGLATSRAYDASGTALDTYAARMETAAAQMVESAGDTIIININGSDKSPRDIAEMVLAELERRNIRRTGSRIGWGKLSPA